MSRKLILIAIILLFCTVAGAAEVLFDFESEEEFKPWAIRTPNQDTWERSPMFASNGAYSARFETPKWEEGMQGWPAIEVKPPITDWSEYDRLVFDAVNPTEGIVSVSIFITDSDTNFRSGFRAGFTLAPRSYERVEIDLSKCPSQVSLDDISLMHFYMSRPTHDYVWHIDNMVLLKEGESLPEPETGFVQQVVALILEDEDLQQSRGRIEEMRKNAEGQNLSKGIREWVLRETQRLSNQLNALNSKATSGDVMLQDASQLRREFHILGNNMDRVESLVDLRSAWESQETRLPYMVGVASSMEKILPRDMPVHARIQSEIAIDLAQNEHESAQIVVIPFEESLSQVKVNVDALEGPDGTTLPAEDVDVEVVGYVETKQPPYEVPYTGWWPDPLLDFIEAPDIAKSNAQSFWIRVNCPLDQVPGLYEGQITVAPANADAYSLPLKVRVRDFEMPEASPLPTAMSIYDAYIRRTVSGVDWGTLKWEVADFLADYYIDFDSLYRKSAPDWDILKKLDEEGRLVAFNLRYFYQGDLSPTLSEEEFTKRLDAFTKDVANIYARARELGIADKAYCYGFDECRAEYFHVLQRIATQLKEVIPDVPIMTTTYDRSYGLASGVTAIDVWVPLTPEFKPKQVEKARAEGRQVWWYICVGPRHPYANWFIEYPAIEARLLMGAMTAKYRPDGFLYYALSRWANNDEPITKGPFTNWNPASFKDNNGDGSIFCPGPDGVPIPTIRLENFRDGLEDYAYVEILEERLAGKRAAWQTPTEGQKQILEQAEAALAVPEALVKSMTEYSRDPAVLYTYRSHLADTIEALGD
ncbi:MAG: DUF4091 domain-containing protein [Candidatus Hydrogenedentota bacterium]